MKMKKEEVCPKRNGRVPQIVDSRKRIKAERYAPSRVLPEPRQKVTSRSAVAAGGDATPESTREK
jgi:hypothetical protein